MKKITLFLSFLIAGIFFATGCKKCETCTTTTTSSTGSRNVPGYPSIEEVTFEACGDDITAVDGKTTTTTRFIGGITAPPITVTDISKTVCN